MNYLLKKTALITLLSLTVFFLSSFFNARYKSNLVTRAEDSQQGLVNVFAFLGQFHFTLYGYTSPNALVRIEGLGIYDQTYADKNGYFLFSNRFSPFSPREACLTSQDQLGRLTVPVCLPPFPTEQNVTIGPVIMPPTLSLDKDIYFISDEIVLAGQSIPNSEIDLNTFIKNRNPFLSKLALIKPAEAITIPKLTTKSDALGNFSIALPSTSDLKYRLFAQTKYDKELSPKSLTLNVNVYPWWMIIIRILMIFFDILRNHALEAFLLFEISLLAIYILRSFFHPHKIARTRALALRGNFEMEIKPEYPLLLGG